MGKTEELIKKALPVAMKACKSNEWFVENTSCSSQVLILGFRCSWSITDCFFDSTIIDEKLFPSMKNVGNDEVAKVNQQIFDLFKSILQNSQLKTKVDKAVKKNKEIIFTGKSIGGSIAQLATIWYLENYVKKENKMPPHCLTFGCPLIGNHIFSHALKREKWSGYFINVVMKYDIVPRILLAPISSIEKQFKSVFDFFKSTSTGEQASSITETDAFEFYDFVMRNASTVASHVAYTVMDSGNLLLGTLSGLIELSPYRPFGTYLFYTDSGRLVSLSSNPNAVLQILFYSCQLPSKEQDIIIRTLKDHFVYESKLQGSSKLQIYELPFSSNIGGEDREIVDKIDEALNELGLSSRGKLCLLATIEEEKQKMRNQAKMEIKKPKIEQLLNEVENYKIKCEAHKVGYYDSFKLQKNQEDYKANIKRLELAAIWDDIMDMIRKYELPDEFEGEEEWIRLGTRFRRLTEPLDVANYYRHSRDAGGKAYMDRGGRPGRYRFPQKWLEHKKMMEKGSCGESCFWAEVEDLSRKNPISNDLIERAKKLQVQVEKWYNQKDIGEDVFFEQSTFVKWWKSLPQELQSHSIKAKING